MANSRVKVPIIYSDAYYVDIGEHVFPTSKYKILREKVGQDPYVNSRSDVIAPSSASEEDVLRAHTPGYVEKLKTGTLSEDELFTMEVPYSPELVEASFICCGGTIEASRMAVKNGAAIHLGGGFHHAFADHGEGFCVLNDIAVAIRALQADGVIERALVIDCDLHQGNGTANIFQKDDSVFTFSIHQENNYPYFKQQSDLDIGLHDLTGDIIYLKNLYEAVPDMMRKVKPDLVVYVAGADPYVDDQLGNLALSKKGLRARDDFVCFQAKSNKVPLAITLAGGYAVHREDTVDIHFGTVSECMHVFAED